MTTRKIHNINSSEIYTTLGKDDLGSFKAYYYQVKFISGFMPGKVLEVGIGNKTLNNILKHHHVDVTTCDFDEVLQPDIKADVRQLPFRDNEFDIVCAFEILEHLPWEDFPRALSELARVSSKNVVISVPYTPVSIDLVIKSSVFARLFRRWELKFFINLAFITRKWKFDGVHYWEMGKRNYPRKKVRDQLKRHFRILQEKRTDLSYQYFFVMEKK
jgi:ubiquinone/menaquinone biosynthesis C-methylase UbiE